MPYMYLADFYCDDCIDLASIKKPDYPKPWDTDDYPAHYSDVGETDCPQHCGDCGCPLDYSLTSDGVEYVLNAIHESIEEALEKGRASTWDRIMPMPGTGEVSQTYYAGCRHVEIMRDWSKHIADYGLDREDKALVDLFLQLSEKL